MLKLIEVGTDTNTAPKPTVTNIRDAFTTDLRNAMLACQKLGFDIRKPAIRYAILTYGGSAGVLAAHLGPEKVTAALRIFSMLGQKYRPYIIAIEKNAAEMAKFLHTLHVKTGSKPTAKSKANAKVAGDMGAVGTLLALGGLGSAIYFVVRQFANGAAAPAAPAAFNPAKEASSVHYNSDDVKPPVTAPAPKKYVKTAESVKPTGWSATYDRVPAPKTIVTPKKPSTSAGYGEDCRGVDACCGFEIINGAAAPLERRKLPSSRKVARRPASPGVARRATNRAQTMQFQSMQIKPGAMSPMSTTLDPTTTMLLDMIRNAPGPVDRRNTSAVINRSRPRNWPGSRGTYSY